jgi:ATP-dependent Lon protease
VRDEAEIRGHRRTYIGSLPGKIVTNLKKAGASNPLFLLDEIDKLGQDFRGDPASALLEGADPEQNNKFQDHYLELDYDLSDVMFVTTANSLNLPQPLLDRMEIIRLEGYTEDEKVEIATRHLIEKQIESHGLKEGELVLRSPVCATSFASTPARPASARWSGRSPRSPARRCARFLEGKTDKVELTPDNVADFAGVRKFRHGVGEEEDQIGAVTGLAGPKSVVNSSRSRRSLFPARADQDHRKARRSDAGIGAGRLFLRQGALAHLRRQAEPGRPQGHPRPSSRRCGAQGWPSAGVGMVTAIVSTLTGIPIRRDIAMTGEVTLRGRVLPIGGLKEKLLAASGAASRRC